MATMSTKATIPTDETTTRFSEVVGRVSKLSMGEAMGELLSLAREYRMNEGTFNKHDELIVLAIRVGLMKEYHAFQSEAEGQPFMFIPTVMLPFKGYSVKSYSMEDWLLISDMVTNLSSKEAWALGFLKMAEIVK